MKSKMPLFILFAGYISSLMVYLIWYYALWHQSQHEKLITDPLNVKIVVVVITVLYLLLCFFIFFIRSLQTTRQSFIFVSVITLLTFFLIPSFYHASYLFKKNKEKVRTEKKRIKKIEADLNEAAKKNYRLEKFIKGLKLTLKSVREENVKLKKQLNEIIRKTKSLGKENNSKGDLVVQAKTTNGFSKIKVNSEVGNADSGTKNQEIIFKVQIISSNTRLAKNSPQFKGLKNVWEYRDNGLYKYTVGDQKDLKSASALQSEFRRKGFIGAFVIAFKNGKRIPLRETQRLLN
jgi:ABC-type multidrug transport system fused ATPase/permease subunit